MDIEELTKSQIILLTLLVSFVTSIATGIVTVSLLDQAPPAITQTINRVVERTVERVVPATQGAVVTRTVVVKEEDLITGSIERNSQNLVRIYAEEVFLGMGFFVSEDGIIATDSSLISPGVEYIVSTNDGTKYSATLISPSFLVVLPEEEAVFAFVEYADTSALKLGQTVVALSGKDRTSVSMGVVSGIIEDEEVISATEEEEEYTITTLVEIDTTVDLRRVIFGSPLINIFGEVVGIHTTASNGYVPLSPPPILEEEEE